VCGIGTALFRERLVPAMNHPSRVVLVWSVRFDEAAVV
jgi:hypothetical protein